MTRTGWTRLHDLARRHHGVVTLGHAVAAGVAPTSFYRRLHDERWTEVFPGTWLIPGAAPTREARLHAAIATSGADAALSHGTALRHLGLDEAAGAGPIHVVRPYGRRADRVPGLVRHRSRVLHDRDITTSRGLPSTTAARTLIDVASTVPAWRLEAMMLAGRQRRLLTSSDLLDQHERRPGLPGARTYLRAATLVTADGADSILERRARRALVDHGHTPAPDPVPVVCGDLTLHLDIAFPEQRFGIECDGFATHGPGQKGAFEGDRGRWWMLQDAGWRITWLTWHRLHAEFASFLAEVHRALDR